MKHFEHKLKKNTKNYQLTSFSFKMFGSHHILMKYFVFEKYQPILNITFTLI